MVVEAGVADFKAVRADGGNVEKEAGLHRSAAGFEGDFIGGPVLEPVAAVEVELLQRFPVILARGGAETSDHRFSDDGIIGRIEQPQSVAGADHFGELLMLIGAERVEGV